MIRSLACVLAGAAAMAASSAASAASTMTIPPATMFGMRVVAIHNQVRGAAGIGPIMWDRSLAAAADAYAQQLAITGRWGHSPDQARPGQGENLWMGTRGAFSVDQMVGAWASERMMFRRGALSRGQPHRQLGRRRPLHPDDLAGQHPRGLRDPVVEPQRLSCLPLFAGRKCDGNCSALGEPLLKCAR